MQQRPHLKTSTGTIYLIVNGDDFGLHSAVNTGILKAARAGILRSASLMAGGAGFDDACRQIRTLPGLAVGLHVTLTHGRPLLPAGEVASLVDRNGHFWTKWPFLLRGCAGLLREQDVAAEVQAQFERARESGVALSHVDSHHQVHLLPVVGRVVCRLTERHGLIGPRPFARVERPQNPKARIMLALWRRMGRRLPLPAVPQPELCFGGADLFLAQDKVRGLLQYIRRLSPGYHELMCHPAQSSPDLDAALRYCQAECDALCDEDVRNEIERRQIKLISFKDLPARR